MDNKNIIDSALSGVGCDVKNCKYHSMDNCCQATSIKVENHSALKKAETFCGTFSARTN